ncbi:caspase family protein [Bradyrhizobium diazoefficiens]|nr:caspase family protein [Bradyrhizobium diazoefficiens]MBR0778424.1 caspase family protein [Bradyrhizobium diazoefficiens]MBR0849410.1 caspase family protein [Bradyrhizobium diazoefficiens]
MGLPEQVLIGEKAEAADAVAAAGQRWFIGIGVGEYDDPELNLNKALEDVARMSGWFVRDCRVSHEAGLQELACNPTWAEISTRLNEFLSEREPHDVVVIYIACHGEKVGGASYLFGRDTPKLRIAGRAVRAEELGTMLGSSKPHNVLVLVDACVAGTIARDISNATQAAIDDENSRDPYRQFSQAIIASTYGLAPARDGCFVEAFLRTVTNEVWTGSVNPWINVDQLVQGLNEELRGKAQRVVSSQWSNGLIQLIPNPNVGRRRCVGLFEDEEFAVHFDPASRGVSRSESGSFFTGRTDELMQACAWLNRRR